MKRFTKSALILSVSAISLAAKAVYDKHIEKFNIKSEEIHPEIRTVGNLIRTVLPNFTESFFKAGSFFIDKFGKGVNLAKDINYEEKYITDSDGKRIRICLYTPKNKKENVPGLLWINGGGFAIGMPEQDYSFIRDFVLSTGCVVVSPDYTKSIESPYPAALNDCYSALLWLKDNGKKYGMCDEQIFVGGNSAGGGLCVAVTMLTRDRKDVNIAFQMPLYPMLDDRMITSSSQNNDAPVWNSKSNELAWRLYLKEDYKTDNVSKYAAPARETDYSGLPPALTYIGTVDPFFDETNIFVDNLKKAGIDVKYKTFDGCYHAFDLLSFSTPAKQARKFLIDGFIYAKENYRTPQNSSAEN